MFCTSCGVKNAADSLFCKRCGHKLESDTAGTAAVNPDISLNDRSSVSSVPSENSYSATDFPVDEQISALLERAYQQRQKGNPNAAVALCRDALRLRPESTSAHSLLGQLFEAAGDYTGAVSEYERVLELNPGSVADRVKLEELRSKSSVLPLRRDRTSGVHFTDDRHSSGGTTRILTAVGGGAILMMLGGILALLFSQRSGSAVHGTANPSPSNQSNQTIASGASNGTAFQNTLKQDGTQTSNTGIASAIPASGASTGTTSTAFGSPFDPPIIYTAPLPNRAVEPQSRTPRLRDFPAASVKTPTITKSTVAPDENRVVLEDKDVIDHGSGSVTIRVPGDKSGGKTDSKSRSDAPGKDDHVIVETDPKKGGAFTSSAASAEALTQMLAGDERKRQKDFVGAIKAYSTALRSAGDDAGYIRQQIGRCYALHGDNTSAVSSYERAIAEYDRLIAAGRQVEQAQNGKRVCEKAIKTCSN